MPTTAHQTGARLPWDARSPNASRSPHSAPDPAFRGPEDRSDALQLAHRVLEAALADEDRITAEMIRRRIAELERPAGSAPGPAKRKLSLRMPPPGPTESFARIMAAWEAPEEAPRKKRRLAFPPPTVHERLAFPPPTAYETRRVA